MCDLCVCQHASLLCNLMLHLNNDFVQSFGERGKGVKLKGDDDGGRETQKIYRSAYRGGDFIVVFRHSELTATSRGH